MRNYRLSLQAEQTLVDIIGWTIDQFGIEQAIKYKELLENRLFSLASGKAPHGKPCNLLVSELLDMNDLEYYRQGRHYIIYRNTDDELLVVDFVHGSRNLEAILQDLSKP
jgi:plasmid stabilization system protein ParE